MITMKETRMMADIVRREIGGCEMCKRDKPLEKHHIRRKSLGGDDVPRNLMYICGECHRDVHQNEPGIRRK